MKARLFRSGAQGREPFEFGERVTIGRAEGNTLRVDRAEVSAEHARIYFDPERGRYVLEDLESLNGTRLDGVRLTRPEPLDRLHVVEFGGSGVEFLLQVVDLSPESAEDEGAPGTAASGTAVEQEMPPLPEALADEPGDAAASPALEKTSTEREMPAVPSDLLAAIDGEETVPVPVERAAPREPDGPPAEAPAAPAPAAGGEAPYYLQFDEPPGVLPIPLRPGALVFGRARSADISVDSPSVSRRHALFTIGETVTVCDLGSRNQTLVDGRRVEGEVELRPGARLRFGGLTATLLSAWGPE